MTSPWLSGVDFSIQDEQLRIIQNDRKKISALNNAVQTRGGGAGFSLDRQAAEEMVKQAVEVKLKLQNDQRIAQTLERMQPPAHDPVSVSFNQRATWNSGTPGAFAYGAGHFQLQVLYLSELIDRLNKALGRTTASDEQQSEPFAGSTKGDAQ